MAGRFGKPDFGSDLTGYKYGLPKEDGGTGERYLPRDPNRMTDRELREWGVMEDRGPSPSASEQNRLINKKIGRQAGKTAIVGAAVVGEDAEGSDDFTEDYNRRYEVRQFNYGPAGQIIQKHTPQPEPSMDWVEVPQDLIAPGSKEYLMPPPPPEGEQPAQEVPERGMVDRVLDILNPQRDRDADLRGTIEDIVGDIARPFVESPVPEAVAQGVLVDAPNGVLSLGEELNEALGAPYITWGPEGIDFSESLPEGAEPLRVPSIMDEGTQAQEVIRGFSQFFSVFGAAGGMSKGASMLKQVKAGSIADVLFDPEYGNLSTLLRELDVDNSLTQYLDSKVGEDADTFAKLEGRAKNILEGAGLGVVLPAVVAGFRAAKRADWGPAIRDFLDKGTEMATGGVVKDAPMESKLFGSAEDRSMTVRAEHEAVPHDAPERIEDISRRIEGKVTFSEREGGLIAAKFNDEEYGLTAFGRSEQDAKESLIAHLARRDFKKEVRKSANVLEDAKSLEEGGASRDEIWEQTGLIRGDEGVWRFEMDDSQVQHKITPKHRPLTVYPDQIHIIDDSQGNPYQYAWMDPNGASLTVPVKEATLEDALQYFQHRAGSRPYATGGVGVDQFVENKVWMKNDSGRVYSRVGEVFDYPELYKIYPTLKDVSVIFDADAGFRGGYYDPARKVIALGTDLSPDGVNSVLLHELQHGIQDIDNLAQGGSSKTAVEVVSRAKKAQRAPLIEAERKMNYQLKKLRAWSMMDQRRFFERFLEYDEPTRQARFIRNNALWHKYHYKINDLFGVQPKRHRPKEERAEWLRNVARFYIDKINLEIESTPNIEHYVSAIEADPRQWKSIYRAYVRELDKVSDEGNFSKKLGKQIDDLEANINDPFYAEKVYRNLAGEIEARTVQRRSSLSKEERRKRSPDLDKELEVESGPAFRPGGLPTTSPALDEVHVIGKTGDIIQKGKSKADPLIEEAKKYDSAEEFVQRINNIHRPPDADYGASLDDVTEMFGDDMYTPNALRYFGQGFDSDAKGVKIIQSLKGKPDAEVTVYRSVLPGDPQEILPGDWVSITKEYAQSHGESVLEGMEKGKPIILSKKVKAKDLFTDANSLQEWGYRPGGHKDLTKQQLTDIWNKAN